MFFNPPHNNTQGSVLFCLAFLPRGQALHPTISRLPIELDDCSKGVTFSLECPIIRNSFSIQCNNTNAAGQDESEIHLAFIEM